jgi:outer membrane lipopolysaccharide assembly protein LptE/RlpB
MRPPPGGVGHGGPSCRGLAPAACRRRHPGAWRQAAVWCALLGLLAGCGYRLSGREAAPAHLSPLAIPMFSNATTVPGLERVFTAAVRERFQRDGRVRLASDAGAAARLRGELTRYQVRVLATTSSDFALEYRVEAELRVTVEDRRQGRISLQQPLLVTAEYVVSPRLVPTEIARQRALQAAAQEAGERLVSLLLDRF